MGWQFVQYKGAFDALMTECTDAMRDALKPRLARLLLLGNQANYPTTEPLGDGLFELRARAGKVRIRLLFGYLPGRRIVFVWGGTKAARKLSPKTIRLARTLLAEAEAVAALEDVNVGTYLN